MRVMRSATIAVFVTLSAGAAAQDVDCDALRATNIPYQVTYVPSPLLSGRPSPNIVEQYERGPDGSGRRLRRLAGQKDVTRIEVRHNFATRVRSVSDGRELDWQAEIEGLAIDRDYFAGRESFSYRRRVQLSTGPAFVDDNTARLRGEDVLTVSGCPFRVLIWDIERRNPEPRPGQPAATVESFWYAPELRGFLRYQGRVAGGPINQDRIATRIDTRFEPFE